MNYQNKKLEEFKTYIKHKKVAIIGMGVSNIPLLDYMHTLGANVTVFDKREEETLDAIAITKINDYGFAYSLGEGYMQNLHGFDMIFRSPSCRPDGKEIVEEVKRGAILTSEIEMLMELCPGKIIGITGSDGKTTTTSLVYEMVKAEGYHAYLGGNIGIPLFTRIEEMVPEDVIVLELSSFQLMTMQKSPDIAVITNIEPNHLDIHTSYEEYIESKTNIFKHQKENGIVVLNYDNTITRELAKTVAGTVVFFSSKNRLDDGYIYDDGVIKICKQGLRKHVISTKDILLRGVHNYENICTAMAATASLVSIDTQIKVATSFRGVEHRLELVREIDGVKWYNDSIGTSPSRTIAGLHSFSEPIILIAGGYDKHLDYTPIAKPIVENVRSLILMGATAEKIETAVMAELQKQHKTMDIFKCENLAQTVNMAYEVAKNGEVVLFSPASASFDLFKNFADRGNQFKELVEKI